MILLVALLGVWIVVVPLAVIGLAALGAVRREASSRRWDPPASRPRAAAVDSSPLNVPPPG
jgi:hypothetical protein